MKLKLLLSAILFCNFIFAQLENHTWYFSPTAKGIKFDMVTNVPSVVSAHAPFVNLHGCGVAANPSTGDVLFYTDGSTVYDVLNIAMPNGSSLTCGTSCAQKGLVVPIPGSCNRFYLFTNTADAPSSGSIYYSIVNMSLVGNGTVGSPKGDVETANKNILLASANTEAITIVPRPNNMGYWLLLPMNASDEIKTYLIDASGISFFSSYHSGISISCSFAIKYSAAAGKVAIANVVENQSSVIMNFNNGTGIFSGAMIIPGTPLGAISTPYYPVHDLAFSPDGTKLYLSKYRMSSPSGAGRIFQYDLNLPANPVVSVFAIPSTDINKTCTGLQNGPDGKIYFIYYNLTTGDDRIIGAINSPNLAGTSCSVNPTALDLGVAQSSNSRFPEFIYYDQSQPSTLSDSITVSLSCQTHVASVSVDVIDNDINSNNTFTNSVSFLSAIHGSGSVVANDSIHYTSNFDFVGIDTITYLLCDNNCYSKCDTGYAFVTVDPCITGITTFEKTIPSIYPSPCRGTLNINVQRKSDYKYVEIYNGEGKLVYNSTLKDENTKLDLADLRNGMYVIKIFGEHMTFSETIVVRK